MQNTNTRCQLLVTRSGSQELYSTGTVNNIIWH